MTARVSPPSDTRAGTVSAQTSSLESVTFPDTPTSSSTTPRWTLPTGASVQGWIDAPSGSDGTGSPSAVWRATGIPYAHADRYCPPEPAPAVVGTLKATALSPACPQRDLAILEGAAPANPLGDLTQDEHCQHLSVTVPAGTDPGERLPVMVWIHGGSYVAGAGDQPLYGTHALVAEQRVITVNVTYRLGMFGFLGVPDAGIPANLGLLDLIEALRWVQENIAAFGGDPQNVTAWGESAGADAVSHLMIAEGAQGLFRRAIIQSAPFGLMRGREAMTNALGAVAAEVPADAPPEELLTVQERIERTALRFGLRGAMPFGPEYGHHPLPAAADLDAAWAQAARRVDVLVGWNAREASLFTPGVQGVKVLPDVPLVGRAAHEGLVRLLTESIYGRGVRAFLARHARARGNGYQYLFDTGSDHLLDSSHAAELPMLFWDRAVWGSAESLSEVDRDDYESRARQMRAAWATFACTGHLPTGTIPGVMTVERAG